MSKPTPKQSPPKSVSSVDTEPARHFVSSITFDTPIANLQHGYTFRSCEGFGIELEGKAVRLSKSTRLGEQNVWKYVCHVPLHRVIAYVE